MTASASRQVEDRRLLNETSGKEGSRVRRAGEAHRLTFTWDSIQESILQERASEKKTKKKRNLTRAAKDDDDNKAINRSLPASRRSSGSECITSTSSSPSSRVSLAHANS